jgi:hypothetical protein
MRVDALIPLTAKAEYWDFNEVRDEDSGAVTLVYFKSKDIRLMVTEDRGLPLIFARDLMRFNGQLRNLTDPNGLPILDISGETKFMFLGSPLAQFDIYGQVMGYKYTVTPTEVG